jgi:hypothetical protein
LPSDKQGQFRTGRICGLFRASFLVLVFLFQKALPIGNTQNPTGQGTLDPSRTSRTPPLHKKTATSVIVVLASNRQSIGK